GAMPLDLAHTHKMIRETLAQRVRNPAVADDGRRDHVRIVTGPQPYRHNHYTAAEFFRADAAAGAVSNIYGQRVLRVTGNFFRALSKAVTDGAGDQASHVQYQIGRAWGEASMKAFVHRLEQEYEIEFEKMGMGMMLETWWWQMRAAGWATWRYDFRHARNGLVFIDLHNSMVADALGRLGAVACSLYAGLYASV